MRGKKKQGQARDEETSCSNMSPLRRYEHIMKQNALRWNTKPEAHEWLNLK